MKEEFLHLLAEVLEEDENAVKMSDNFREYEAWDSLTVLSVLAMINEQYEAIISPDDLMKCQTVEDLYNCVMTNKV